MNLRSLFSLLLLTLLSALAYGQKIDTIYYDADWKESTKKKSSYYRVAKTVEPGKVYDVEDYFNSGKIQMKGTYSSLSPEVKNGLFICYYENGNKKSEAVYENNKNKPPTKYWKEDGTIDTTNYVALEKQPVYPGGINKLYTYISENFNYPKKLAKLKLKGTIMVSFVIDKDGSISEVYCTESVHPQLDAEAIRVVSGMKNWEPGIMHGKPVRVKYNVPISMN